MRKMMQKEQNFLKLIDKIKNLDIFNVVYEDIGDIESISNQFAKYKSVLVFGTGGSSLGSKALINFKALFDGKKSKVHFLENVDSRSFINTINSCDKDNTGIIVISKSGRTTETLMLFLTLISTWKDFDYKNNAIAITEDSKNNDLRMLAESKGMKIYEHSNKIGGRFSVFSIVGLLPSLISGVNARRFLDGAKKVLSEINSCKTYQDCKIYNEIINTCELLKNGVNHHVIFSYSDFLGDFGKWFVQLTAESLGKTANFGVTPISAVGTIDQHSMLQLFLGGPGNKYYTVITQKNNVETNRINSQIPEAKTLANLNEHNIHELMLSHQKATIEVLKKKAHVRVFDFEEINEEAIGYMMMLSFVETVAIADIFNIDPFDQPAVEESKKLVSMYLNQIKIES